MLTLSAVCFWYFFTVHKAVRTGQLLMDAVGPYTTELSCEMARQQRQADGLNVSKQCSCSRRMLG
jgi:hypothetical protein